jgi:hypothetical protein
LDREVCCDEKSPCVPTITYHDNSNNQQIVSSITTRDSLEVIGKKQQLQQQVQDVQDHSHKGKNSHSKNTVENEELEIEHLKPDLNSKIKEVLEKNERTTNTTQTK